MTVLDTLLAGINLTGSIPDIMEFCLSPEFLNRPNLYPRQGTLLKLIFCQEELFTEYDYEVIEEWTQGFTIPPEDRRKAGESIHYEGNNGLAPDILDRMRLMRSQGRGWFREILPAIGRRGGKGYIGGLSGAYVIWYYHELGDPQGYYGVARDKRLGMYVFAGKREQAKANQWRDIVNVILGAPCFTDYVSRSQGELLSLLAPNDKIRSGDLLKREIKSEMDPATFEIVPKESTLMAGRGPALFAIYFDEMAHVVASGANRSAEEVWGAATPALDQFAKDAFIYCGSSTWQMMGQFYEECQQALEIEPDPTTGELVPVYPEKLFLQLTSWDIYKDWERAHEIPLVPEEYAEACYAGLEYDVRGKSLIEHKPRNDFFYDQVSGDVRCYPRIKRPIQTYDEEMRKLERANPETFRVERRSHWATTLDAYLNPNFVDRMWQPWSLEKGDAPNIITQQTRGLLNRVYVAHGDPSKSGANFGWAIAHTEGPDADGLMHVVFDVVHAWKPSDFEEGYIDYIKVMEDLCGYIDDFVPSSVSFDQFNSAPLMAQLRQHIGKRDYPRRVDVFERTATRQVNWAMAEAFKTALGLNLIHAPFFELADLELKFLQDQGGRVDHPDSGPVQTKDVADAMMNVVWGCIGEQMAAFIKDLLSNSEVRMALPAFDSSPAGTDSREQQIKDGLAAFGRARGIRPMPPRGRGERGFNPTPKRPT